MGVRVQYVPGDVAYPGRWLPPGLWDMTRKSSDDIPVPAPIVARHLPPRHCAIPLGVLIAGSTTVDYAVAAPMMAALTLATIVLFAMLRTRLFLSRNESIGLLMLYALFVAGIGL